MGIPSSYEQIFLDGRYLETHPTWHVEESPFKAKYILRLLRRNELVPKTICEAACGAGEVLRRMQLQMPRDCEFWGYEFSPQAFDLCLPRGNDRLHFQCADFTKESNVFFDLLLVLDVIEQLEDYFSFLRAIRTRATHKVFHFPLDISVQAVLRQGMMRRREEHADIHYFSKELALAVLQDTGYEVIDYFYTPRSNEIGPRLTQKLLRLPRTAFFALNEDIAVRVLGGYSLMVLAK